MFHGVKPLMCLAAPCAFVALSLTVPVQAQTINPTVSYLYVGGPDAIHAYNVAADGTMTAMRGAPFLGILNTFIPPVVNGTYMFAWDGDITSYDDLLYLYKIEAGGVLKRVNAIDFGADYDIHFEENMFLDKKGETLYVTGDDFDEQVIHSFQVNWDKGTLTNLGGVEGLPGEPGTTGYFYYPPKFIANDKYLFTGTGYEPRDLWVGSHKQRLIGRRPIHTGCAARACWICSDPWNGRRGRPRESSGPDLFLP